MSCQYIAGAASLAVSDIMLPGINLCIAQHLRADAPGSSGAEAILLSEAEQRELLYVTLERAQRAVLGFGALGVALAGNRNLSGSIDSFTLDKQVDIGRVQFLQQWANDPRNKSMAAELGRDFAAAVQLHAVLSVEMAELLSRSADARSPRGGSAASIPEDVWGPGSWRQKTMAALFGGYALAHEKDGSAPWTEPTGMNRPGATTAGGGFLGFGYSMPWPSRSLEPYPMHTIRDARTFMVRQLATQLPKITLSLRRPPEGCAQVDADATGDELYVALENKARSQSCHGICSTAHFISLAQLPSLDAADLMLWKTYRIAPEHARSYGRYLADLLDPICLSSGSLASGMTNIAGGLTQEVATWDRPRVSITPETALSPKDARQRASEYSRLVRWRMPTDLLDAPASEQGFIPQITVNPHSAYRHAGHLGSLSTLVAAREALHSMTAIAQSGAPSPVYAPFMERAGDILDVINAAAGKESFTIRPKVLRNSTTFKLSQAAYQNSRLWDIDLVGPKDDPFWTIAAGETLQLFIFLNDPLVGSRVLAPTSLILGSSVEALLTTMTPHALAEWSNQLEQDAGLRHYRGTAVLDAPESEERRSFVVRKSSPTGNQYKLLADRVMLETSQLDQGQYIGTGGILGGVAERVVTPDLDNPVRAKYDAFGLPTRWVPPSDPTLFGGQAGASAVAHYLETAKQSSRDATEAVREAMQSMLEQQTSAAAQAAALERAGEVNRMESAALCGEGNTGCETGIPMSRIPVLKWKPEWVMVDGTDITVDDVCPTDVPDYPVPTSSSRHEGLMYYFSKVLSGGVDGGAIDPLGTVFGLTDALFSGAKESYGEADLAPNVTIEDKAAAAAIYCDSLLMLARLANHGKDKNDSALVDVADVVGEKLDSDVQPSFEQFAGGSLQSVLIEQWAAYKSLQKLSDEYLRVTEAAVQKVLLARVAANAAIEVYRQSCNPAAASRAKAACWSVSVGFPSGATVSFSPGPWISYEQMCKQLAIQAGPAIQAVEAEQAEAMARVSSFGTRFVDAIKTAHLTSAMLNQQVQAARMAQAKNDLELKLLQQTDTTSFGLYRRYHSYDLWRAKALVESSRRRAVAARRAIEARFGVDLADMHAPEPFVAAPVSWVDEVYAYDLSLPAAVGVTVGTAGGDGIYANKLYDYVTNLESFVQGYAVLRPTATAHEDTEVVSFPGPYSKTTRKNLLTGEDVTIPEPAATQWKGYCPGTGEWVSYVKMMPECVELTPGGCDDDVPEEGCKCKAEPVWVQGNPCKTGPAPTRAVFSFMLDPWGRLGGQIADEPYTKRHNTRWTKLAVNLVGTGVQDCALANDPYACYGNGFARYNLIHVGPAWISNYIQDWLSLPIPFGHVEGGKAIAAEYWLDPLFNAWSKPHVQAAARTEFNERPIGGAYTLEILLGPEFVMERVERVQILLSSTYWVAQGAN